MISGICSAEFRPEQLARAAVAAALGEDRRRQIADAGDPGEVSCSAPRRGRRPRTLARPAPWRSRLRSYLGLGAARQAAAVLRRAGDLTPSCRRSARNEAGLVEVVPSWVAEVRVAGCRAPGPPCRDGLLRMSRDRRATRWRARNPLRDVFRGERGIGATIPLLSSRRTPLPDAVADRAHCCGSAARRTARQTRSMPASSMSAARLTGGESGEADARSISLVRVSLISSARSGVRVPSWTSRPPRASQDATAVPQLPARSRPPCGAAQAAEPLPLQLDHRPDPGAHGVREGG